MYGKPDIEKTLQLLHHKKPQENSEISFSYNVTFDGVNPFISTGTAPFIIKSYLYDSMMFRSPAEPFTLYPLIVKVAEVPKDRTYVVFEVTEDAAFDDGTQITSEDILFTFNLLKNKGRYNYQVAYKDVSAEIISPRKIKFHIHNGNRELPLILGLMPVFSKAQNEDAFLRQSMEPVMAARAFQIHDLVPGKTIHLTRNPNYYGKDHPLSCLRFHFDHVKIEFFRNEQAAFESLRAGQIDFFYERDLTRLNRSYDFLDDKGGAYKRYEVPTGYPSGLYGFVFNTRRSPWNDIALRRVISDIFSFDMLNRYYLYNTEQQIKSIFMRSDQSDYQKKSDEDLTTHRMKLEKAFLALKEAGYHFENGVLHDANHQKIKLNILLSKPKEEKYALFLQWMLKDIGIETAIHTVDDSLYQKRLKHYDYDMIIDHRYVSGSPGIEQRNFWGCTGRTTEGTRNYAGICDSDIEAALEALDKARTKKELQAAISEIDKNVMEGHYYIPLEARLNHHIIARKDLALSPYGVDYFYRKNI
ncbi:MAG: extracellular solute-binding protein [Pseudomonadota bacterium]